MVKIFLILFFFLIFSAFQLDEIYEDAIPYILNLFFGCFLFIFFKKKKKNVLFGFLDFFSHRSLFFVILDKENHIILYDQQNQKKIDNFLESESRLNNLLEYLNVPIDKINLINFYLKNEENFETKVSSGLNNLYDGNNFIFFYKISLIFDKKTKNKILFFSEDDEERLLDIANHHNLGFLKISNKKEITNQNNIANNLFEGDKYHIFDILEKNFLRGNESFLQKKQSKFFYIKDNVNYLISVFEVLHYDVVKKNIESEFIVIFSKKETFLLEEKDHSHVQKMEIIGRCVGGVAHDFNNLLTGMLGFCDLLLDKNVDKNLFSLIVQIKKNIVRAIDLIKKLLIFSKKSAINVEVMDVNDELTNIFDLMKMVVGENILININYSSFPAKIKINRSHFEQIIMNLVVNARDAIIENGEIKVCIYSEKVEKNNHDISKNNFKNIKIGEYIVLKVSDNGAGMDEEYMSKIFEPFFTTKQSGTGLGLATIYEIMQKINGYIFVESEKSIGSSFYLYFPKFYDNLEKTDKIILDFFPKISQNLSVVLVEDEDSVRDFINHALTGINCKVFSFASSEDCLVFLKNNNERIDLIISDVMMPKLSGHEIARFVQNEERYKNTKFLFISGYMENQIVFDLQKENTNYLFLSKPFGLKDLLTVIDNIKI